MILGFRVDSANVAFYTYMKSDGTTFISRDKPSCGLLLNRTNIEPFTQSLYQSDEKVLIVGTPWESVNVYPQHLDNLTLTPEEIISVNMDVAKTRISKKGRYNLLVYWAKLLSIDQLKQVLKHAIKTNQKCLIKALASVLVEK